MKLIGASRPIPKSKLLDTDTDTGIIDLKNTTIKSVNIVTDSETDAGRAVEQWYSGSISTKTNSGADTGIKVSIFFRIGSDFSRRSIRLGDRQKESRPHPHRAEPELDH